MKLKMLLLLLLVTTTYGQSHLAGKRSVKIDTTFPGESFTRVDLRLGIFQDTLVVSGYRYRRFVLSRTFDITYSGSYSVDVRDSYLAFQPTYTPGVWCGFNTVSFRIKKSDMKPGEFAVLRQILREVPSSFVVGRLHPTLSGIRFRYR